MNTDILAVVVALGVGVTILALGMNHKDKPRKEPKMTTTRKTVQVDGVTYYAEPTTTRKTSKNPFWKIVVVSFILSAVGQWGVLLSQWNTYRQYHPEDTTTVPNFLNPETVGGIIMGTLIFTVVGTIVYYLYNAVRRSLTREPEYTGYDWDGIE